jgi:hypothetical protein
MSYTLLKTRSVGMLLAVMVGVIGRSIPALAATCYGDADCRACKTCRYCKHCAKEGGTCGVCKRLHAGGSKARPLSREQAGKLGERSPHSLSRQASQ